MGIFKGLKERMKAVDNLTKSINDGDIVVDRKNLEIKNNKKNTESKENKKK